MAITIFRETGFKMGRGDHGCKVGGGDFGFAEGVKRWNHRPQDARSLESTKRFGSGTTCTLRAQRNRLDTRKGFLTRWELLALNEP